MVEPEYVESHFSKISENVRYHQNTPPTFQAFKTEIKIRKDMQTSLSFSLDYESISEASSKQSTYSG